MRRRLALALLGVVLATVLLGVASFQHARSVARQLTGPLPAGVYQSHEGLVPFRAHPNGSWGWVIAYGPEPGEAHAEIYVSLRGAVIGTNPPDLIGRLPIPR